MYLEYMYLSFLLSSLVFVNFLVRGSKAAEYKSILQSGTSNYMYGYGWSLANLYLIIRQSDQQLQQRQTTSPTRKKKKKKNHDGKNPRLCPRLLASKNNLLHSQLHHTRRRIASPLPSNPHYPHCNSSPVLTNPHQIASVPKPKWTVLSHRRLQIWPSALSKTNILLGEPLPPWLETPLIPKMQELGIWDNTPHGAPNHVLVNEYQPGEGIMPHEDGPAYYPMVATVSLGAPIVLDVFEKGEEGEGKARFRILQERRRYAANLPLRRVKWC